jgi:O-antigen/teichoic acid export membrane protein
MSPAMSADPALSADTAGRSSLGARLRRANPLPEGTFSVGVGLLVNGIGAYAFTVLAARGLGEEEFSSLAVLWAAVFLAAPGLFLPVEQEVSRTVASRRARGEGSSGVVRQAALLGLGLFLLVAIATMASLGWTYDLFFDEQALLLAGFLLALIGYCIAHLVRGVLAGGGRFDGYALYFGAEGALRVAIGVTLLLVGVATAGPYGLTVGLVPFVAVAIAISRQRHIVQPGPPSRTGELTASLGALLAGSLLTALLLNAGPLAIEILADPDESAEAGRFLAGLLIARVPLFLFQAVQAALLPKLALLASGQRWEEFSAALRKLLVAVGVLGVTATLVAWSIGPTVVRLTFGEAFVLGNRDLGLLALSSSVFMLAVALGQSLIALSSPARMAVGWAAGVVVFALVTALGDDLYLRVELGLVAGTTTVAMVLTSLLVVRLGELGARSSRIARTVAEKEGS